jgi:hypothetical protein
MSHYRTKGAVRQMRVPAGGLKGILLATIFYVHSLPGI